MLKKVVITGLGLISPLGNNVKESWENIKSGKSGVRNIIDFDTSNYKTKFAGTIKNFSIEDYCKKKNIKKFDPFIQYGIAAGMQAIIDSKINNFKKNKKNTIGIIMGSGIGGLSLIEKNTKLLDKYGPNKISPMFIPGCIINMTSGYLAIINGFHGLNLALATSCATGTHAIGLAAKLISIGETNIIIAGSSEKASTPLALSGFSATRALSTRNDFPDKASRPWDVDRDGFVLGDGAGCIVLEEYEHAINRNAEIYAEICGFGMSCDAYHITSPTPDGNGTLKTMKLALKDAKINPHQLDYINAHGTSTIYGDISESMSIERLLGKNSVSKVYVNSTKSMLGHSLGAAGSIEAVITALSIKEEIIHPTINLNTIDKKCKLNYVKNEQKKIKITYAMSNSFGFGGTNASIIFKKIQ
ncbi:MAG TPA: beta-ketoacyl-ACP synthase II [Candidatus Azoamicus sp. OHIO1]